MTVHLIPPTLTVLGKIISKRIPLSEHFSSLYEWMKYGWTLNDCQAKGFPRLRLGVRGIGGGLAVACTECDNATLLWIYEVSCHEWCGVTGGRKCTHLLPILQRMKLIENNHKSYLQTMPGYARVSKPGNFAHKKEADK